MSTEGKEPPIPQARQLRRRFSWVWVVPLIAVAVVAGLAIRAFVDRGPLITISFSDAEGIQAGDTKIRHKDVDVGTVESLHLNSEMSRVFVRARMRRSSKCWAAQALESEPAAGSFVHDMF